MRDESLDEIKEDTYWSLEQEYNGLSQAQSQSNDTANLRDETDDQQKQLFSDESDFIAFLRLRDELKAIPDEDLLLTDIDAKSERVANLMLDLNDQSYSNFYQSCDLNDLLTLHDFAKLKTNRDMNTLIPLEDYITYYASLSQELKESTLNLLQADPTTETTSLIFRHSALDERCKRLATFLKKYQIHSSVQNGHDDGLLVMETAGEHPKDKGKAM